MTNATVRSRKQAEKEKKPVEADDEGKLSSAKSLKAEPLPSFPKQRIWTRMVVILCTLVIVYFTSSQDKVVNLARVKDDLSNRRQEITCSPQYFSEVVNFPGCTPAMCGRIVMDYILTQEETARLLKLARRLTHLSSTGGGSDSPTTPAATVVDLSALSRGSVDGKIKNSRDEALSRENKILLSQIRRKIREVVAIGFKIDVDKLNFTTPSFVSRLTSNEPISELDEYWHSRADKNNHKSFHYSAVVFLNGFDMDFKGGRFIFEDPENVSTIVEAKAGRLLTYTSGQENVRRIERILSGDMYALTVPFTCDPNSAVDESVK